MNLGEGQSTKRKIKAVMENLSLAPAWLRRLGYYGLALLLVGLGVVVRMALTRLVGPGLPTYITFYPLVMLAALIGGWGPGLVAILATAAVADYWLLLPRGLFKIESRVDLVGLAFFCGMGLFVSVVAELYRRLRGHLEDLVTVRTAALSRANDQLQEQAEELRTQAEELQAQTKELTAANARLRQREQALRESEEALRELNATLESKVAQRTVELEHRARQLEEARDRIRRETEARIAALEQLRHEDRLKTVGRLASGIAHELGTPLNVISGYAGMIAGGNLPAPETVESAQIIKAQSERIATIVRQILDFARRRPGQKTAVDLRQLIRQTLGLMAPLAQKQNIRLTLADGADPAVVRADAEQIRQVLLNLITNAVQAMPRGGSVELTIDSVEACPPAGQADPGRQYVGISVQDQGEGISQENLSRIFEPFFTTKGPGKGTGLGLSVAEGIVREHGGWITVDSTLGKGSRFCVCLAKDGETCRQES